MDISSVELKFVSNQKILIIALYCDRFGCTAEISTNLSGFTH